MSDSVSARIFDDCCGAVVRMKPQFASTTGEHWVSEVKKRYGLDFSDCCMCYSRITNQEKSNDCSGNGLSPEPTRRSLIVRPSLAKIRVDPEFILWIVFDRVWLHYDSDGGWWSKFEDVTPGESDVLNAYNANKDRFECGLYIRPT